MSTTIRIEITVTPPCLYLSLLIALALLMLFRGLAGIAVGFGQLARESVPSPYTHPLPNPLEPKE